MSARALAERALAVLRANDTGDFIRPGPRVYPFQWNWDSALVALGLARVDPDRGRAEVRSLLRGQWTDGMLPHIVFHTPADAYRPGPELWDSAACLGAPAVPTSGITQPPVLATAVRALHEAAPDGVFLEEVLPALERWHHWLHAARDFDGSGLVAILHPWESADNSPRFDRALARVELRRDQRIQRTDRSQLSADERPTDRDYRRYLIVVERLRQCGYRPSSPADAPFAYIDLCLNAILAAGESDLAWLWRESGESGERASLAAERLRRALAGRWDESSGAYRDRDLHGGETVSGTVADVFPLYGGAMDRQRARRLWAEALWSPDRFGPSAAAPWAVTTVSKASPAFDPRRYWRGPVWININWFLIRGLQQQGLDTEAAELRALTLLLVERSGFAEYYEPSTGAPLGSESFSWSAALTLDLLLRPS